MRTISMPTTATGHGLGGLPRPPFVRIALLVVVSCLSVLASECQTTEAPAPAAVQPQGSLTT